MFQKRPRQMPLIQRTPLPRARTSRKVSPVLVRVKVPAAKCGTGVREAGIGFALTVGIALMGNG